MPTANLVLSAYLALMCALIARAYYAAEPLPPAVPAIECKGSWRGCSKGCSKVKGKCVPLVTSSAKAVSPSSSPGHALMKRRTVSNCLTAADAFEESSKAAVGEDVATLQLLAAEALNCAMRIKGDGNIILVEGTSDTPANKRFWGDHAAHSLALARAALSTIPSLRSQAKPRAIELDAFVRPPHLSTSFYPACCTPSLARHCPPSARMPAS